MIVTIIIIYYFVRDICKLPIITTTSKLESPQRKSNKEEANICSSSTDIVPDNRCTFGKQNESKDIVIGGIAESFRSKPIEPATSSTSNTSNIFHSYDNTATVGSSLDELYISYSNSDTSRSGTLYSSANSTTYNLELDSSSKLLRKDSSSVCSDVLIGEARRRSEETTRMPNRKYINNKIRSSRYGIRSSLTRRRRTTGRYSSIII